MIRIPGYSLKREIGVGGMASVYLAVQTSLERQVALKVMAPALAADQSFSKRFLREARTVAGLSHPNIVSIYDVGITQAQVHYFSMQYMSGGDFADRIRKGIREREIIRVLIGIAEALGYAHKRGFVHRDVTPGNILFDASDTPVLTDFGIVKAVSDSTRITGTGLSIGTSHYMSPEQARGRAVDARADLYSLGAVTYEALAGQPPFEGEDGFAIAYSHVFDPIPKLPQRLSRWQPFIERAMAKNPDDRFQTAAEMIEEMEQFLETTTGEGRVRDQPPLLSFDRIAAAVSGRSYRRLKVLGLMLKGPPGSLRYALADSLSRLLLSAGKRWNRLCRYLFFFLPQERQLVSGLVTAFLMVALSAMNVNWGGGALPVSTRVSMAATPDHVDMPPSRPVAADDSGDRAVPGRDEAPPLPAEIEPRDIRRVGGRGGEDEVASTQPGDAETDAVAPADGEADAEPVDTLAQEIESTLELARADLAANRLTTPEDGNAVQRFEAVLAMAPGNEAAVEGLSNVVSRYLDLAESEMRRADYPKAALYIERGEAVAAGLSLSGSLAARLRATRGLAHEAVIKAAREAHTARRVDEAIALYQAALIFEPENEDAIAAIAALRSGQAANQSFTDELSSGEAGPELVVVELAPFRLETPSGTLVLTDRRQMAVTVSAITVGQFRRFVEATGYFDERRNRRACRDQESIWRSSRRRTWENPGFPQGDDHPVVCVTWDAAQAYAAWLSSETGLSYRLPAESEWEYLASRPPGKRGEAASRCELGNIGDLWLKSQYTDATVEECEDGWAFTAPIESFLPNEMGVYDMLGNVREWVADCWVENRRLEGLGYAPNLNGECDRRVVKGTAWLHGEGLGEIASRIGFDANDAFNTVGFRLIRTLD